MPSKRKSLAETLTDPNKSVFVYLFLGVYGLAVASDALSDVVKDGLGPMIEARFGIGPMFFRLLIFSGITVLLLTLFAASDIVERLFREVTPGSLKPHRLVGTYEGLVVVMSLARPEDLLQTPAAEAIKHHWLQGNGNLRHCWILCSGEQILKSAQQMIKKLINQPDPKEISPLQWVLTCPESSDRQLIVTFKLLDPFDIDNPNVTFDLINRIYQEAEAAEIESEQIIADYTGGTKSMTAGMVLACAGPDRQLQFMKPGAYLEDGRADREVEPIPTMVDIVFKIKPFRRKSSSAQSVSIAIRHDS